MEKLYNRIFSNSKLLNVLIAGKNFTLIAIKKEYFTNFHQKYAISQDIHITIIAGKIYETSNAKFVSPPAAYKRATFLTSNMASKNYPASS